MPKVVTVAAPINIAFIKYWGKVDEVAILPCNDSFSITLGTDQFRTVTSVVAGDFEGDKLWLNGEEVEITKAGRLGNVLEAVRMKLSPEDRKLKVRVVSENNFPTAAGMASSAAGLAALAFALTTYFNITDTDTISTFARIGSGSACRSVVGGFVKWVMGTPTTSISVQHRDHTHWPGMNILCLVSKPEKKDIPSTVGMRHAVTSPAMEGRVKVRVPERMAISAEAVERRDFESFAAVVMADCEDFREVCRTSTPKVDYWNDTAEDIITLVKGFNDHHGKLVAAYTYDAGANAFIFIEDKYLNLFLATVLHHYPTPPSAIRTSSPTLIEDSKPALLSTSLKTLLPSPSPNTLTYILHSKVGSGPVVLPESEGLVGEEGVPLR